MTQWNWRSARHRRYSVAPVAARVEIWAPSITTGFVIAMWIFALEAFVALGMLVLIVWLTMGSSRRRDADASKEDAADTSDQHRK